MSKKKIIKTGKEIHEALKNYDIHQPNTLGWFLTEQGRREQEALEKQKWYPLKEVQKLVNEAKHTANEATEKIFQANKIIEEYNNLKDNWDCRKGCKAIERFHSVLSMKKQKRKLIKQ